MPRYTSQKRQVAPPALIDNLMLPMWSAIHLLWPRNVAACQLETTDACNQCDRAPTKNGTDAVSQDATTELVTRLTEPVAARLCKNRPIWKTTNALPTNVWSTHIEQKWRMAPYDFLLTALMNEIDANQKIEEEKTALWVTSNCRPENVC